MSILSAVGMTQARTGIRAVITGVEKVGKTTLACNASRALLAQIEVGAGAIKVMKTPLLEQFSYVIQLIDEITAQCAAGTFPYHSVVFDSSTALERLIHSTVLQTDPTFAQGNKKALVMESALGGYGKAYQYANELFEIFLKRCDTLALIYGINIIITCHVFAARVVDPTAGEYDTWDLLLHSPKNQKNHGKREMLTQWADLVGFLHEPLYIIEASEKTKGQLNKAVSANKGRILAVNRAPGYVAGNRYNLTADIQIPAVGGWNQLAKAIYDACGLDYFNRD